jgi:NAD(P)-dependent dehydrogenase (short-subunit alcohol dehydrogenase family)
MAGITGGKVVAVTSGGRGIGRAVAEPMRSVPGSDLL